MFVQLEKIRLHYQVVGEGKPIIFLHGFFGISDAMMEIFEPIFENVDGWRRIYIDAPGNGDSEAPEWVKGSDEILDVVEQFIDHVIPDQNFCLAGWSYGGFLSLGLIHRRPKQIDGLVLVCPLVEPEEEKRNLPEIKMCKIDDDFLSTLEPDMQESIKSGTMGLAVCDERVMKRADKIYTPGHQKANRPFLDSIKERGYEYSFDIFPLPVPFPKPTLILTGRFDNSVGYRDTWKFESQFPRATFVVLDAAAHSVPVEQEGIFVVLVKEWIERLQYYHD